MVRVDTKRKTKATLPPYRDNARLIKLALCFRPTIKVRFDFVIQSSGFVLARLHRRILASYRRHSPTTFDSSVGLNWANARPTTAMQNLCLLPIANGCTRPILHTHHARQEFGRPPYFAPASVDLSVAANRHNNQAACTIARLNLETAWVLAYQRGRFVAKTFANIRVRNRQPVEYCHALGRLH